MGEAELTRSSPARQDLWRLDGRVALVTGASAGLGARFVRVLHQAGAEVLATARRADRLADLARGSGGRMHTMAGDITDPSHRRAACNGYEQGSYDGNGQGGFILTLTNTSGSTCYLYGYPGLGLEDANHHVLPSHTHWGSTYFAKDPGRQKVVLSPGENASASVAFVYTGTHKAHATYLEVTPPNAYDHASIKIPNNVGQISTDDLYVTAMARHTPWKGSDHVCC
jgi:uncharacterized protein DUF4232/short subunit dehydrogenase